MFKTLIATSLVALALIPSLALASPASERLRDRMRAKNVQVERPEPPRPNLWCRDVYSDPRYETITFYHPFDFDKSNPRIYTILAGFNTVEYKCSPYDE